MNKIIASFSGGRSSAYMVKKLKDKYGENLIVVFMNTGLESEETLSFVFDCDYRWGLNVIWLEADVNHEKGIATSHKITCYQDAVCGVDIAKEVVRKYGLFGVGYLHCTREMKIQPFNSWRKANKLQGCPVAIGIRADEIDRIDPNYKKKNIIYPLVDEGADKRMINEFWKGQKFDLKIHDYQGNCRACWKKSDKKLSRIALEDPGAFVEMAELEKITTKGADKMFRGSRSAKQLVTEARLNENLDLFCDNSSGCETCEII